MRYFILETFIFMYAKKFFPNREVRMVNTVQCRMFSDALAKANYVVTNQMLKSDYKGVEHESDHISGTDSLEKVIEMIEKYAEANQTLIEDHDRKVRIGMKTSR